MEVLKKGKECKQRINPSWELVCVGKGYGSDGCGAVLLVSENDMYLTLGPYSIVEDREVHFTFRCPNCNVETYIVDRTITRVAVPRGKR